MNEYAQDLKTKLEQVDEYVLHTEIPRATNVFTDAQSSDQRAFPITTKNILWLLGAVVISISVVAFFTQTVLLVAHNIAGNKTEVATVNDGQDQPESGMYIRADLQTNPFGTSTNTSANPARFSIPGVSRIGYSDSMGEDAISNNINKYSDQTLVIGGREEELGGREETIGGGDDTTSALGRYGTLPKSVAPVLSSKAYLVADLQTGELIVEKNADTVYPLASVSKLMTAVVARANMDLQSIAIVSRDASGAYGAQGELGLGEKIRLRDLQFPLLMESSNDAAEVFADQFGHAKFIEEMNKKAASLEMTDTYYGDPSGLDPQNTSTPKDLLKLAQYIMKNDPEIFDMTRVKQFSIKNHTWHNTNYLLTVAGFVGGKNGYIDQSKQTTVSLFDIPLAKGGVRTVVIIILKSDAKNNDVIKLINYLKRSVTYQVE